MRILGINALNHDAAVAVLEDGEIKFAAQKHDNPEITVRLVAKLAQLDEIITHIKDANSYIKNNFANNYGSINQKTNYPTDFQTAKNWFKDFLEERFVEFGDYEDAILKEELILNHSLLSPLINCGLLTPSYVVNELNEYAFKKKIPINSYEGIIRQIIGWREFIRGIYISKGSFERTRNYWGFTKKMPDSFYTAVKDFMSHRPLFVN